MRLFCVPEVTAHSGCQALNRCLTLLNVRTTSTSDRIRTAALELFARQGYAGTSVRQVAGEAEVSPGLVIHHFGSKDGLRRACDEHAIAFIRRERSEILIGRSVFSTTAQFVADHPEIIPISRYLGRMLGNNDEAARALFDRLVDAAADALDTGVRAGLIRPTDDPEARAVGMAAWNASSLVLGDLVAARLGGDSVYQPEVSGRIERVLLDIYRRGVLTDDTLIKAIRMPEVDQQEES